MAYQLRALVALQRIQIWFLAKHPHTKNKSKQTNKRPASYDFNQEFRREISGLTGRQHHGDWKAFLGRGTASLVGMQ